MTVQRLVSQADNAMYQAKAEGRNRYVAHDGNSSPPLPQ
jgi:PleD family two-component response regulator